MPHFPKLVHHSLCIQVLNSRKVGLKASEKRSNIALQNLVSTLIKHPSLTPSLTPCSVLSLQVRVWLPSCCRSFCARTTTWSWRGPSTTWGTVSTPCSPGPHVTTRGTPRSAGTTTPPPPSWTAPMIQSHPARSSTSEYGDKDINEGENTLYTRVLTKVLKGL